MFFFFWVILQGFTQITQWKMITPTRYFSVTGRPSKSMFLQKISPNRFVLHYRWPPKVWRKKKKKVGKAIGDGMPQLDNGFCLVKKRCLCWGWSLVSTRVTHTTTCTPGSSYTEREPLWYWQNRHVTMQSTKQSTNNRLSTNVCNFRLSRVLI